jgi:hypothetical protein
MTAHVFPPPPAFDEAEYSRLLEHRPALDLLAQAIEHVRPHLDRQHSIHDRARAFWAGLLAARRMNVAASDVIEQEFNELAHVTGLTADIGRQCRYPHDGQEDVDHVIRWTRFSSAPPFSKGNF